MKIILIPGLGYDNQIFKNLDLLLPETEKLNWIDPEQNESFHKYANRLFSQVSKTDEKVVLIGHSMGGMAAQEIASFANIHKVILISSIKSRKENPFYFKIVSPLRLDKFFSKEISIWSIKFWGKNHGFKASEDIDLFKSMLSKQTNRYLQWALRELSLWKEPLIPNTTQIVQIHGTDDKTFPIRLVENPDFVIEKGSHILVHKQAKKVAELILSSLEE